MSFSLEVKEELASCKLKSDAQRFSVLAGVTLTAGNVAIGGSGITLRYVTECYGVARLIVKLSARLYDVMTSISVHDKKGLNSRNAIVSIEGEGVSKLIEDTGLLNMNNSYSYHVLDDENKKLFLMGAFLGAGSINDPKKSYHMEIVCRGKGFADALCNVLGDFSITAKCFERKESYVVYIKDADGIFKFLAMLGAAKAAVELEEIRVIKDVKNGINRKNNCESANMQKTALAAAQQLMAIEIIRDTVGLDSLSSALRAAAEARLNNREATLSELADMLEIGKSGMSHRMKRLIELAESLIV